MKMVKIGSKAWGNPNEVFTSLILNEKNVINIDGKQNRNDSILHSRFTIKDNSQTKLS